MSRAFQQSCLAVLLFVGAPPLPAEDNPCTTRTVPVTVVDSQGSPVTGLTAANFRGRFRGKPVEVISVTPDTRPRRIVMIVDASGSMVTSEPRDWAHVPTTAAQMFRMAPPYSRLALLVFAGTILRRVGFDQETSSITKALEALPDERSRRVKGLRKTALYDAMATGLTELNPPTPGDVIFAITDAGDNSSKTKPEELEQRLLASGVRLFVCMPFREVPNRLRTPEEANGPQNLTELVKATGGNLFSFISSGEHGFPLRPYAEEVEWISRKLSALSRQMDRYDRVEVRMAHPVNKPREWKLEILGENGKPNRNLTVLYPHRLMPCNAGQKTN